MCLIADVSRHIACRENVIRQQCCNIASTSAAQFYVHATDADAGEFQAYLPTDNRHCIVDDDDDDAACYSDHYDDNYQVDDSQ